MSIFAVVVTRKVKALPCNQQSRGDYGFLVEKNRTPIKFGPNEISFDVGHSHDVHFRIQRLRFGHRDGQGRPCAWGKNWR